MGMIDIIKHKRDGGALSPEEIAFFVEGAAGTRDIPDYQLAAMLMAIFCRGMTPEETSMLTIRMAESGAMADLSAIPGICVDKHSTGGVGDTTTLVLTPLCAACGAKVAKMSGRGLGHTGGTLDKLESIPGMRVELSMDAFIRQIQNVGCAVVGQSTDLAPADKRLYKLRDVTATVDSLPLIVSSIMSKKIAAGSGAIVLDVKTGSGALMHTLEGSIALAEAMVHVGASTGRPTQALVTGMDQPLGTHIGNALEVKEAIDILSGRAAGRLLEVSLALGAMMLVTGRYARDEQDARRQLSRALDSGAGLAKLEEMIAAQGGDARVCKDTQLLPTAGKILPLTARRSGYITAMDTEALGEASRLLGAGRRTADDVIDPAVGLVMAVQLGDHVQTGQTLLSLHVGDETQLQTARAMAGDAIQIENAPAPLPPLAYAIVREGGVERFA